MANTNNNQKDNSCFNDFKIEAEINGGNKLLPFISNSLVDSIVETFVGKDKPLETIYTDVFNIIEYDNESAIKRLILESYHIHTMKRAYPKQVTDNLKNCFRYDSSISDKLNMNIFFVKDDLKFNDFVNYHYKTEIDDFYTVQINLDNGKKYVFIKRY